MIIPPGFAQVNLKWTGTSVPLGAQSTFGVENASGLTADQIADAVGDSIAAGTLKASWVATCQINSILVKRGPNDTGSASELGYVIVGTMSGTGVQPQVSYLIQKITELGGRHGRGRLYWPGCSETFVNNSGVIDTGVQASFQGALSTWRVAMATANLPLVLLHSDATSPTPITNLNVQTTVATQRRRLRR